MVQEYHIYTQTAISYTKQMVQDKQIERINSHRLKSWPTNCWERNISSKLRSHARPQYAVALDCYMKIVNHNEPNKQKQSTAACQWWTVLLSVLPCLKLNDFHVESLLFLALSIVYIWSNILKVKFKTTSMSCLINKTRLGQLHGGSAAGPNTLTIN